MVASCGAEPIHPETVEQFINTFGPRGFRRTTFAPAYGLAEATLLVTVKRAEAEPSVLRVAAEALADSIVKEAPASETGNADIGRMRRAPRRHACPDRASHDARRVPTERGGRSVADWSRDRRWVLGQTGSNGHHISRRSRWVR